MVVKQTPIPEPIVNKVIAESGIKEVGRASIREIKKMINDIEDASGIPFIRMEMGIPGLPACQIGVNAQIEALKNGCAAKYPDIEGTPELKKEMSCFVKNFLDLKVSPEGCIPTVG
jgi:aspartate/methionine/tyrosine aminotransferase